MATDTTTNGPDAPELSTMQLQNTEEDDSASTESTVDSINTAEMYFEEREPIELSEFGQELYRTIKESFPTSTSENRVRNYLYDGVLFYCKACQMFSSVDFSEDNFVPDMPNYCDIQPCGAGMVSRELPRCEYAERVLNHILKGNEESSLKGLVILRCKTVRNIYIVEKTELTSSSGYFNDLFQSQGEESNQCSFLLEDSTNKAVSQHFKEPDILAVFLQHIHGNCGKNGHKCKGRCQTNTVDNFVTAIGAVHFSTLHDELRWEVEAYLWGLRYRALSFMKCRLYRAVGIINEMFVRPFDLDEQKSGKCRCQSTSEVSLTSIVENMELVYRHTVHHGDGMRRLFSHTYNLCRPFAFFKNVFPARILDLSRECPELINDIFTTGVEMEINQSHSFDIEESSKYNEALCRADEDFLRKKVMSCPFFDDEQPFARA